MGWCFQALLQPFGAVEGCWSPFGVKVLNFLRDRYVPFLFLEFLVNDRRRRQRFKVVIAQRITAGAHHGRYVKV